MFHPACFKTISELMNNWAGSSSMNDTHVSSKPWLVDDHKGFNPTLFICIYIYLVGGIPTSLKNMKVSWDDELPNIWKAIKFHGSKPPIRYK